jgi:ribose transport system permease protein
VGLGRIQNDALVPILGPILLLVVFAASEPRFLSTPNLQNMGVDAALLMVLATGTTYVILMGAIDLSLGALFGLGQVLVAMLVPDVGLWSFGVAVALGGCAGVVNGLVHVGLRIPSFLASLGMAGVWLTVALLMTDGTNVSIPVDDWPNVQWVAEPVLGVPKSIIVAAILLAGAIVIERRSTLGSYLYAIGANEEAARVSGVPVERYKIIVFGLAGAASTGGGALSAGTVLGASPTSGNPFVLIAIAAVVVGGTALSGGIGGIGRTVAGVAIITILGHGLTYLGIDPFAQQLVTGALVIVAVAATMDRSKRFVTK